MFNSHNMTVHKLVCLYNDRAILICSDYLNAGIANVYHNGPIRTRHDRLPVTHGLPPPVASAPGLGASTRPILS
jgi:hypothetical protein